mmetsp:Transcript_129776/g.224328  ORF Transcript_129776/g.224328 Transcript_129776/m.224328 type:complete len:111 (-) Transcript_129776:571-903(-)
MQLACIYMQTWRANCKRRAKMRCLLGLQSLTGLLSLGDVSSSRPGPIHIPRLGNHRFTYPSFSIILFRLASFTGLDKHLGAITPENCSIQSQVLFNLHKKKHTWIACNFR